MKSDQYAGFEEIMERAAILTYQQKNKNWRILLNTMFEELAAYELEDIRSAVVAHVRTEKFFPALADIIRRIEGSPEDRAMVAWANVMKAIAKTGYYDSVRFPSPAYHYAIEQMGGWMHLTQMLEKDGPWRAKEFMRWFAIGEQKASWGREDGRIKVPAYLRGFFEIDNGSRGFPEGIPAIKDAITGKTMPEMREALKAPDGDAVLMLEALAEGMKA